MHVDNEEQDKHGQEQQDSDVIVKYETINRYSEQDRTKKVSTHNSKSDTWSGFNGQEISCNKEGNTAQDTELMSDRNLEWM
ncbi:hypothetical protein Tco_0134824 [Tanacetum coccineum]